MELLNRFLMYRNRASHADISVRNISFKPASIESYSDCLLTSEAALIRKHRLFAFKSPNHRCSWTQVCLRTEAGRMLQCVSFCAEAAYMSSLLYKDQCCTDFLFKCPFYSLAKVIQREAASAVEATYFL